VTARHPVPPFQPSIPSKEDHTVGSWGGSGIYCVRCNAGWGDSCVAKMRSSARSWGFTFWRWGSWTQCIIDTTMARWARRQDGGWARAHRTKWRDADNRVTRSPSGTWN